VQQEQQIHEADRASVEADSLKIAQLQNARQAYETLEDRKAAVDAAQTLLDEGCNAAQKAQTIFEQRTKALQQAMDQAYPSLTRPIQLSSERYNQHLTTGSLILEVGTCGNSLAEAIRGAELFAEAAAPVLRSLTGG
jgi:hypothetical protein